MKEAQQACYLRVQTRLTLAVASSFRSFGERNARRIIYVHYARYTMVRAIKWRTTHVPLPSDDTDALQQRSKQGFRLSCLLVIIFSSWSGGGGMTNSCDRALPLRVLSLDALDALGDKTAIADRSRCRLSVVGCRRYVDVLRRVVGTTPCREAIDGRSTLRLLIVVVAREAHPFFAGSLRRTSRRR